MNFSFPAYLDRSVISELENYVISVLNCCRDIDTLSGVTTPLWTWAGGLLKKTPEELRLEIETHETDEHFPDKYLEEKDHLLKLPLLLLEKINSSF